jgi:hypothetical protein
MADYPKTLTRGVFKGRTFENASEYQAALDQAKKDGVIKPRTRAAATTLSTTANGVTRQMAVSLVQYVNVVLAIVPQTRDDVLEDGEIEAIALGVLETARSNKYFANLIVKTCRMQSGSRLAFAVGAVVARRVAKRDILPIEMRVPVEIGAVTMLNLLAMDDVVPNAPEPADAGVVEWAWCNGNDDAAPVPDPFAAVGR